MRSIKKQEKLDLMMVKAIADGRWFHLKPLVEKGASIKYLKKPERDLIVSATDLNTFITLIELRVIDVDSIYYSKFGRTSLHEVAILGDEHRMRVLLARKAKVDSIDYSGNTPLLLASACGNKNVVESLLEARASINHRNQMGSTALHAAAKSGSLEIVECLIANGARPYFDLNVELPSAIAKKMLRCGIEEVHAKYDGTKLELEMEKLEAKYTPVIERLELYEGAMLTR